MSSTSQNNFGQKMKRIQVVNSFVCFLTKFERKFNGYFCSNVILTTKSSELRSMQQHNQSQTQPHHSHKSLQNSKAAQRHHGPEQWLKWNKQEKAAILTSNAFLELSSAAGKHISYWKQSDNNMGPNYKN